jgi:hypothetical protein
MNLLLKRKIKNQMYSLTIIQVLVWEAGLRKILIKTTLQVGLETDVKSFFFMKAK